MAKNHDTDNNQLQAKTTTIKLSNNETTIKLQTNETIKKAGSTTKKYISETGEAPEPGHYYKTKTSSIIIESDSEPSVGILGRFANLFRKCCGRDENDTVNIEFETNIITNGDFESDIQGDQNDSPNNEGADSLTSEPKRSWMTECVIKISGEYLQPSEDFNAKVTDYIFGTSEDNSSIEGENPEEQKSLLTKIALQLSEELSGPEPFCLEKMVPNCGICPTATFDDSDEDYELSDSEDSEPEPMGDCSIM